MIIQCTSCGKSVSSKICNCPYCRSQINDLTLEMNGIEENIRFTEKVRAMMLSLVHR